MIDTQKEKPILNIYILKGGNKPEANQWIANLESAINNDPEIDFGINTHNHTQVKYAFWEGVPFIVVGNRAMLFSFLKDTYDKSPSLVSDHAYFWCVSNLDQDNLDDEFPCLNSLRVYLLNWKYNNHNIILSYLKGYYKHLPIIGLSEATLKLRSEIYRLSKGEHGPWSPILILGESGVGKEMVAEGIFQASSKQGSFSALACAWLNEHLLQDQLFGHAKGAFTNAHTSREGLLESNSNGAILFDDIDTAPLNVQGALLRIMSTARGERALYNRLGETQQRKTSAWLMFATNADIEKLVEENKWRNDFLFRFEDRVIHVLPLRQRQADIPAIAKHIWQLCCAGEENPRKLPVKTIKWLCAQQLQYSGNVRSLRALLSLVVSMTMQPAHNSQSIKCILEAILSRGADYHHWMGIIASPTFTGKIEKSNPRVSMVLELDKGFNCYGSNKKKSWIAPSWANSSSPRSELETLRIIQHLEKTQEGILHDFKNRVEHLEMSGSNIRPSVRLSRVIVYLNNYGEIDKHACTLLNNISEATATKDLSILEKLNLIRKSDKKRKNVWFREWTLKTV
jgi:DNA-binding NtrC family response regulator